MMYCKSKNIMEMWDKILYQWGYHLKHYMKQEKFFKKKLRKKFLIILYHLINISPKIYSNYNLKY